MKLKLKQQMDEDRFVNLTSELDKREDVTAQLKHDLE